MGGGGIGGHPPQGIGLLGSCPLAWPRQGTCLLSWARYLQQAGLPTAQLAAAVQRLQRQHATAGRHVLRLHRRAEGLLLAVCSSGPAGKEPPPAGSAPTGAALAAAAAAAAPVGESRELVAPLRTTPQPAAADHAPDGAGSSSLGGLVVVEAEVVEEGLQACGGPLFVELAVPRQHLPGLPGCSSGSSAAGEPSRQASAGCQDLPGQAQQLPQAQPHQQPPRSQQLSPPRAGQEGGASAGGPTSSGPPGVPEVAAAQAAAAAVALLGASAQLLRSKATAVEGEHVAGRRRPRLHPYPLLPASSLPGQPSLDASKSGGTGQRPGKQRGNCGGGSMRSDQPSPFMWIEPLPPLSSLGSSSVAAGNRGPGSSEAAAGATTGTTTGSSRCQRGLVRAGVLHAQKSAQHLILACSSSSLPAASHEALPALRALRAAADASVVAVDALVHDDGSVDATWLLFLPELQYLERSKLPRLLAEAFRL